MTLLSDIKSNATNYIINGNFDIFQRDAAGAGTALSTATSAYNADRFNGVTVGATSKTLTMVQDSTDVPTYAQSLFQSLYSLKMTSGAATTYAAADALYYLHTIEGYEFAKIHQQAVRFSFWAKVSVTGTYSIAFNNSAGTRSYVTTYSVPDTGWNKYTIDLTLDTGGTWLFDHQAGLKVYFILATSAGTSNFQTSTLNSWQTVSPTIIAANTQTTTWGSTNGATFRIAQVSLAPVAQISNAFVRAGSDWAGEELKCKRYYHRLAWQNTTTDGLIAVGFCDGNATLMLAEKFPVRMRTIPTGQNSGSAGNYALRGANNFVSASTFTFYQFSYEIGHYLVSGTQFANDASASGFLQKNGTAAAFVAFNAEY